MIPSFYGKLRAQEYDIGTDPSEIVGFYLAQWERLGKPTPLLEPMCGTGLNLIPFLQAGAAIDGLDASPHMLAICQAKLDTLGLSADLYQQNLEQMRLPRKYGMIFIPGGSYGHIYDQAVAAKCLRRMYEQLLPGGWLVLDIRPPAFMIKFGADGLVDHDLVDFPDGSTLFTTGNWQHLEGGRVIRKWNKMERFLSGRLVETEIFDYRERLYEKEELFEALKVAGFEAIRTCKAFDPEKQAEGMEGIVFFAKRA
jgi:ubiquinone/menaquinone biosynthesis C-methylase UbiE